MNILVWFIIALVATLAFWNLWAAVALAAGLLVALGVWGLWCLSARSQNPESRSQNAESGRSGVPAATGDAACDVADAAPTVNVHMPMAVPIACAERVTRPRHKAGYNKSKKRKHR